MLSAAAVGGHMLAFSCLLIFCGAFPTGDFPQRQQRADSKRARGEPNGTTGPKRHFQLIAFDWEEGYFVRTPYTIAAWLLCASAAKIVFRMNKRLSDSVPDSALLIVLGLGLGLVLRLFQVDDRVYRLDSHVFFLYLLPPIIFDAGFFMPNRQLFENLDSVLLFAFVGTIWNTAAIGSPLSLHPPNIFLCSLFGVCLLWLGNLGFFSVPFSAFQILLFASLISAVDPVAVIAVFEEIHINAFLFINVFGEALFNDGVSVVLYQMFRKFDAIGPANLDAMDCVEGILSFLVIAVGGVLFGLVFAALACIATKHTTQVRVIAPVFIFAIPYLAYLSAEMFGLSSILAIVTCAIGMKQYVKGNLTHDAYSSAKYFTKMLAQCSETVIFMFLGLSLASYSEQKWDLAFVVATIGLCLMHRVIGVVAQCAVLNRIRRKKFSLSDQFVLSYGGLRGAIAFGLVISTHQSEQFPARQMFITTTLAVIFFTVFVQGITIRPLLLWLKVEKQHQLAEDDPEKMSAKIFTKYADWMMSGLEAIAGHKGNNTFRDAFERFNAKVLKPMLMRDEEREEFDASTIVRAYKKITLQEAARIVQGGSKISRKTAAIGNSADGHQLSLPARVWRSASRVGDSGRTAEVGRVETAAEDSADAELLYAMFSRLLDRKLGELRAQRGPPAREDDIKDDYMGIIGTQQQIALPETENGTAKTAKNSAMLRAPKLLRRESTSPGSLYLATGNGAANNGRTGTSASAAARNRRKMSLPGKRATFFQTDGGEDA